MKDHMKTAIKYIILIIIVLLILIPLYLTILYSIKTKESFIKSTYKLDLSGLTLDNFYKVLVQLKIYRKLFNSFITTIGGTSLTVLACLPAAYSMCKLKGKIYGILFAVLVVFAVMPEQIVIFSQYEMYLRLNINNFLSVIFSYTGKNIPECLLFLCVIIKSVPGSIIEAAYIDGCKETTIIKSFIIPLSSSGIIIVSLNMFLNIWNDFLIPMVLIHEDEGKTIMQVLALIGERFQSNVPFQMAANIIAILPPIIIYGVFKNRIIEHTYGDFLK